MSAAIAPLLPADLRLIEEIRLPSGDKQELVGYKTKQVQTH